VRIKVTVAVVQPLLNLCSSFVLENGHVNQT
jgi:hypothetical protein